MKKKYGSFLLMVSGALILPSFTFAEKKSPIIQPEQTIQVLISVDATSKAKNTRSQDDYLVDSRGYILLPLLGVIKVGGLNKLEASRLIYKQACQYFEQPTVSLKIIG